jgi:5-hydroxyisourate hydrolase
MTALPRSTQGGDPMGRVTTHILDTAQGCPAAKVGIRLFHVDGKRRLVMSTMSNSDGRTDEPLVDGDAMQGGCYELEFDIGPYFSAQGVKTGEPAFLDTVVIRFSASADEHYHVPLLASPWSYSTYRGS